MGPRQTSNLLLSQGGSNSSAQLRATLSLHAPSRKCGPAEIALPEWRPLRCSHIVSSLIFYSALSRAPSDLTHTERALHARHLEGLPLCLATPS